MRLIDADALFVDASFFDDEEDKAFQYVSVEQIHTAPTVDAVEVVRCKDCTHYGFTDNRVPKEQVWWCYKWSNVMRENDYCGYGEKNNEID